MINNLIIKEFSSFLTGYLVVKENDIEFGPKVERNEWIDLIKHYWLIWLIVLLVGLLIVIMPVVG